MNYIHKYYIDPRAKTPHPPARIENALDELKVCTVLCEWAGSLTQRACR